MIRYDTKNGSDRVKVTFVVPKDEPVEMVSVVGDFNAWDPSATPLRKRGHSLLASVSVDAGRCYAFRYLSSDGRWFNDEAADAYEANPFGSENGIVDLTGSGLAGE